MDDLKKEIQLIRESQIRMEEDLRYHIKRTDILESKIDPIHTIFISTKQLLLLIITSSTIVVAVDQLIKILGK